MSTPKPLAEHALAAEAISKAFVSGRVRTQVLENLSLRIEPAELTLISGPSGYGKSTLLAILSGMEPVDAGRVTALKSDLDQLEKRALERFRLQHTGNPGIRWLISISYRCRCGVSFRK